MKKNIIYIFLSFLFLCNSQLYASQFWKSMILPGWAEKDMGYTKRGKVFTFTEYFLWSGFVFSDQMSASYEDDYHNHAIFYADVDWSNIPEPKSEENLSHLNNFEITNIFILI